ncbi:MAG: glycerophosphodiester phosphodiesterase [Propionibacteriaceae bacterium]|jgi:glycerophosphoryl diester phosphodiesterase|nr:glycerophosphodiester phosphodiesterase [Micropruina sp.]HBX81986.1 hypothetical protein [Propionibacteriaceae bacterium]
MTLIWAHRGDRVSLPENTLPAFARAMEVGADGVEFDVQLASDGVPVVIHDETVDRTTNGTGRVMDLTSAALGALDAGLDGVHAGVPTLAEVLDLLAPSRLRINIELKNSVEPYPGLEEAVVRLVVERGLVDRVVYSSFNHDSLAVLVAMKTGSEVGVLVDADEWLRPWEIVQRLGADALHCPRQMLRIPGFVAGAREAGVPLRVWTVNRPKGFRRCLRAHVDGIITDDPALALAARDAAAKTG